MNYLLLDSDRCVVYYTNDTFSKNLIPSAKKYLTNSYRSLTCEFVEIESGAKSFDPEYSKCSEKQKNFFIMGDTVTHFVDNVTCVNGSAENIHFTLSRRYISSLFYNSEDDLMNNFNNHLVLTSYYGGLENEENLKMIKDIKTYLGDADLLSEEDFISFYEILIKTRDAIETKKTFNASSALLYFKDMKINTPEGDNIKVTNGRYFSKHFYLTRLISDNNNSSYHEELYVSYPSPLFSNGYDWSV